MLHQIRVIKSVASSLTELGRGITGTPFPKQPEKPLKLYEYEASPFCRRVREVCTHLNLDLEIYPCPRGGKRFRPIVQAEGGKLQFPFLIDENTGDRLYESTDIIAHLFKHYSAEGHVPKQFAYYPPFPAVAVVGTLINGLAGGLANRKNTKKQAPAKLLELWSFEASPFARIVRAKLSELEIPYILHNVPKERWQDMGMATMRLKPGKYEPLTGGKREQILQRLGGRVQIPYLEDPNTDTHLFESKEIIDYLEQQYG